ncbi:hypothetical protein H0H93_005277 [Arthromyces matolae]|nr:hypothetical protein H0H93_005277 [Arthromyces matolae]
MVSQALDVSFEGVGGQKKRDTLTRLLLDSIRIRVNISTTSKAFHSIMEPLLYEIIVITRFETIPRILSLLRRVPPGRQMSRGHTCRRLDIHIPINLTKRSEYFDEAWDVGRHTLWGLLAACPNLEVLTARIIYIRSAGGFPNDSPHLGHNALCKTISTYCARTLRRLELSGFDMSMDRIEMMLRYMLELEACSISNCRPFNNIHNQYPLVYPAAFSYPKEYDQNEEEEVFGIIHNSDVKFRKRSRLRKSTLFSDRMLKRFYSDKDDAQWPPFHGGPPPYPLPKLHYFHLDQLNERIFEFDLPSLRFLSTGLITDRSKLLNTNLVPDVNESDDPISESGLVNERPSKYDIDPYYRHYHKGPHYTNPIPHSTPFGPFPSTITHLILKRDTGMNLARILYFFPNLTNLTWSITSVRHDPTPFWKPHEALQHLTMQDYDWSTRAIFSPKTLRMIHQVLDAVKDGWLLSLSNFVLAFLPRTTREDLPFEKCKELGIELEVVDI